MLETKTLQKISLSLLVIMAIVMVFLGILVHYHSIFGLDVYLSRDLQAVGNTTLKKDLLFHFLYFVSIFGRVLIAAIMVFMTAIVFAVLKYYREAIFTLLTPIAAGINFIVKIIVDRNRPTDDLVQVLDKALDPSFPSGHVVFYVVFFGYLIATMFFVKKIPKIVRAIIMFIAAGLIVAISFSRVYLGTHWTTDVIAGYMLGLILLSVLLYFYLAPKAK